MKFDSLRIEIYSGIARFSLRLHGFLVLRSHSVRCIFSQEVVSRHRSRKCISF